MLVPRQRERLKWADWAVRGNHHWSNKLSYCHNNQPSFYSLSLSPTLPQPSSTTHTHTYKLKHSALRERGRQKELWGLSSDQLSPPLTVLVLAASHHEPQHQEDTRQTLNHSAAIHTGRLTHTCRHMMTHTFSHSPACTKSKRQNPIICPMCACERVEGSADLLPRDLSFSSCGLKNHFPILRKPLFIRDLQEWRGERHYTRRKPQQE